MKNGLFISVIFKSSVTLCSIYMICLAGMIAVLCLNELAAQSPNNQLIQEWVCDQAIDLETVSPGSNFDDLEPLREIAGKARIVGLGENTHGTREFNLLRHRILEFLVREMDFNILAVEASLPEAMDVNRYVLHGEGDPARALAGMYFWTIDTEEMLSIIHWMYAYNQSQPPERKVRFYGCDMQFPTRSAKMITAYFAEADPKFYTRAQNILAPFLDPFTSRGIRQHWTDVQRSALTDSILNLLAHFEANMDVYASASNHGETDIVRRHLEILLYFQGYGGITRDEAMAQNVKWIMEHEGPESKAVLWAHNAHISVNKGWQGFALREMYADEYVAVGFMYGEGGFQARDVLNQGALTTFYVDQPSDTLIEAFLNACPHDIGILDLMTIPEEGPIHDYFHSPQFMRSCGSGYTEDHPEWYVHKVVPAAHFDAFVYIQKTTPARTTFTGRSGARPYPASWPVNLDFEITDPGKWPLGWEMPRGVAQIEWDVSVTNEDARSGRQSLLIHRAPGPNYGETHASISQRIDAGPWLGQSLTLSVCTSLGLTENDSGHLWLEVTTLGEYYPETVIYQSAEVTGQEWTQTRITSEIPENAYEIAFGFAFSGDGRILLDDFSLE